MTTKKRPAEHEPFLNTVARKLGHAAGALTKATQEWTDNFSALPETVTTKVREVANPAPHAERPRGRTRPRKNKVRSIARSRRAKGTVTMKKGSMPKDNSPQKPANIEK